MILIDRARVPAPPELSNDEESPGSRERKRTAAFYGDEANWQKPYGSFKAYKLPGVVKALNDLFNAKCAYCESNIGATQPTDVEHFRPKGGYVVRDKVTKKEVFKRPGYHWLAASWDNLIPSCIDCNRERFQELADGDFRLLGKANKFPLVSERTRAVKEGDEKREKHLLLNPCLDKPEKYLEFTEEGQVRAALDLRNKENPRGKNSIVVYGLARKGLAHRRFPRAREVLASIKRLKRLEVELNARPESLNLQEMLLEEMVTLKTYMLPTEEYAGMSRQLIKKVYSRIPS